MIAPIDTRSKKSWTVSMEAWIVDWLSVEAKKNRRSRSEELNMKLAQIAEQQGVRSPEEVAGN